MILHALYIGAVGKFLPLVEKKKIVNGCAPKVSKALCWIMKTLNLLPRQLKRLLSLQVEH